MEIESLALLRLASVQIDNGNDFDPVRGFTRRIEFSVLVGACM